MKEGISAVEAKFEAQKIAFAPLVFQAARALLELGILRVVSESGVDGITRKEIAEKTGVSEYGAAVLSEIGLGIGAFNFSNERFTLGKTGWFLLEDDMTRVNFNFVRDVCYNGADFLTESVRTGKPRGLSVFGENWRTIYEALSSLPEQAQKSWFDFDHFYSDIAFSDSLPIVFAPYSQDTGAQKPVHILDIGGNTAKWAIACCKYNSGARVTIIDIPVQFAAAKKNIAAAGYENRISFFACNVLDETPFPRQEAGIVWMSQFLDCFSLDQITFILKKIAAAVTPETDVFVLEPFWDKQKFPAASFSLQAASLYFTCMANGNSKMYRCAELTGAVEKAGFVLKTAHHNIGSNDYSLMLFKKL
ncbi:MAG: class I SAM-dependent methyltransferase [Spirochaetaceae bacterium]|jgi:hypothetical protein|nr:class I SAM-dependent methyltransferase [Spirochaetaceae bacterium]